jgi:hypothetical protein
MLESSGCRVLSSGEQPEHLKAGITGLNQLAH